MPRVKALQSVHYPDLPAIPLQAPMALERLAEIRRAELTYYPPLDVTIPGIEVGSRWRYEGSDGNWYTARVERLLPNGRVEIWVGYYRAEWEQSWFSTKERVA